MTRLKQQQSSQQQQHSRCALSVALLASQIIRTELLLQRHQIQRQLEQQRYRSNKLSQQLQSQQRSNQDRLRARVSDDRLAPESHPGTRQQRASPAASRCHANPGQQAQDQQGLPQNFGRRPHDAHLWFKEGRISDGTQG